MSDHIERQIIGTLLSYVEAGEIFGDDDNVVSKSLYPDPETYPDSWHRFGDVADCKMTPEEQDISYLRPSERGGYKKVRKSIVTQDIIKVSLEETSEPAYRLQLGAESKIVDGTEFAPFAALDRSFEGWVLCQGRALDRVDRVVMCIYIRAELDKKPDWTKDPALPAYTFYDLDSDIKTAVTNRVSTAPA